jgi:hypothetical protein
VSHQLDLRRVALDESGHDIDHERRKLEEKRRADERLKREENKKQHK